MWHDASPSAVRTTPRADGFSNGSHDCLHPYGKRSCRVRKPQRAWQNPPGRGAAESIGLPAWVTVDASKLEGVFKKTPDRDEFGADIKEALIVELYSR